MGNTTIVVECFIKYRPYCKWTKLFVTSHFSYIFHMKLRFFSPKDSPEVIFGQFYQNFDTRKHNYLQFVTTIFK